VTRDEAPVIDDERADPTRPERAGSPRLILGLRVALLLIAAAAATVAATAGLRGRDTVTDIRYACPMHAEVRSAAPGECPICRMALERIGFVPGAAAKPYLDVAGTIDLRAIDNVKKHNIVDFVRRHALPSVLRDLRGPAWVDDDGTIAAIYYNDQIQAIAPGDLGTFALGDAPESRFAARRTDDAPVAWDRSTSRIRFRGESGTAPPTPGQTGWLEVTPRPRQVLSVSSSAVLQAPEGPYVLAWSGHGYDFVKRPIEIGETFLKQGLTVVLSGLQPNDRVIARATFFVDADRRLGADASQIALGAPP